MSWFQAPFSSWTDLNQMTDFYYALSPSTSKIYQFQQSTSTISNFTIAGVYGNTTQYQISNAWLNTTSNTLSFLACQISYNNFDNTSQFCYLDQGQGGNSILINFAQGNAYTQAFVNYAQGTIALINSATFQLDIYNIQSSSFNQTQTIQTNIPTNNYNSTFALSPSYIMFVYASNYYSLNCTASIVNTQTWTTVNSFTFPYGVIHQATIIGQPNSANDMLLGISYLSSLGYAYILYSPYGCTLSQFQFPDGETYYLGN